MKVLALLIAVLMTGCAAQIRITDDECTVKSARKTAITCQGATVITGEVLLNQESVQVLGKQIPSIVGNADKED